MKSPMELKDNSVDLLFPSFALATLVPLVSLSSFSIPIRIDQF